MMKISGRVTWCCVALLLALTSVSAVQRELKSIIGLKKINFGQSVPKHSLLLLHWFANEIDIDNNDIIQLTFDPNSGDYGSHHYGNYEELLDPLPQGNQYQYLTIGNLHQGTSNSLPAYVAHPQREYQGENRDRIIVRVREQNRRQAYQTIDQVYITQHYDTSENQGTLYDPYHTYWISTNLLREIREFAVGQNQQPLSYLRSRFESSADDEQIRNTWGQLACLGLLLYIVIQEKHSSKQQNNRPKNRGNARNERGPNVPKNVVNQCFVGLYMGDDEDRIASRRPVNTESHCCNKYKCRIIGCVCGIACIVAIVSGIIIYFFVIKKMEVSSEEN